MAIVRRVGAEWTFAERVEHFRCRAGAFRMRYLIAPGLYAIGEPDSKGERPFNWELNGKPRMVLVKDLNLKELSAGRRQASLPHLMVDSRACSFSIGSSTPFQ